MVFLLNSVSKRAAAAMNVSMFLNPFFFSIRALCSPTCYKKLIKPKRDVNSKSVFWTSIVGKLYLHRANIFPNSVKDKKGEVIGETPPSRSYSAKFMHILNSYKVSPPSDADIKTPSGTRDC